MIIELNKELKETIENYNLDQRRIDQVNTIVSEVSRIENCGLIPVRGLSDTNGVERFQLGFLDYFSSAYSAHRKITILPHVFWYAILTDISNIISNNSEKCRRLFTKSAEKVKITIISGDPIEIDPIMLMKHLNPFLPIDSKTFLPTFTTSTPSYSIAAAAFAGGLKTFYDYGICCCGIPEVKIAGTIEDWLTINNNLGYICDMLIQCGIESYEGKKLLDWSMGVKDIIVNICYGLKGEDISLFMKDIFSEDNIGSGGDKKISGWITKILCCREFLLQENYSLCIASLPYTSLETKKQYIAAYGLFNTKRDTEGFTYPDFDHVTLEKK